MTGPYTIQPDADDPKKHWILKDGRPIAGPKSEAEMIEELKLIEGGEV